MKHPIIYIPYIFALFLISGCSDLSPQALYAKVSPSVTVVHSFYEGQIVSQGSGVTIGVNEVITNCHVLIQGTAYEVRWGNKRFGAEVVGSDIDKDLCLLRVRDLDTVPVELGQFSKLKIGDKVYAVGAPKGLELTLSEGLISSLRGEEQNIIQTTATVSPGSSGGGLFDSTGRLVGITTFAIKDGQRLNFAIPVDWVLELKNSSPNSKSFLAARAQITEEKMLARAEEEERLISELEPVYIKLNTFTVNLADQESYLQVDIQLLANAKVNEEMNERIPEVRDVLLRLLSSKTAEELSTPDGKDKLANEIQTQINDVLGFKQKSGVKKVLFGSFIIQ